MRRIFLLFVVALGLNACGSPVSASNGDPTVPLSQAGTYSYTLTFTGEPAGCNPQVQQDDLADNGCFVMPMDCAEDRFSLTSDGGSVESLASSGTLYLSAGNWTGSTQAPCPWTLTLTPQ
jgi:uncharacterized protein YceK